MKQIATILLLMLTASATAQNRPFKRPFTQAELQRFSAVCSLLVQAMPASFKNYQYTKKDCSDMNSFNFEIDGNGSYLTGTDSKNQSVGYLPSADVTYTDPSANSVLQAVSTRFDYAKYMSNPDSMNAQEARTIKLTSCKAIRVVITINSGVDKMQQLYHRSTLPETLLVPKATMATLFKMPYGKPITEEDGSAQHHSNEDENYADRAIITFGATPSVSDTKAQGQQSYNIQYVTIPDDGKLVLMDKIHQLTVFIYGSEKDIREFVTTTDWSKVYALIGK